jgi:carbon-monoxide dehydrogenase medium subunit
VKPAPFAYHAPTTVAEAVGVLAEHGDEAKVLAGGQSLVPLLALRLARFGHLVDLNRVPGLDEVTRADGYLEVGAMTRQAVAERSPSTAAVPLLARAIPLIGHFQIRNRGTVGGSIAHADPASELPAVALALDATLVVASPAGERSVPAGSFFVSTWTTSLEPEDVLTAVRFPVWEGRCGFAIEEFARRSGDFAVTGVACAVGLSAAGDRVERAALALFGMGPTPLRAGEAEAALRGAAVADLDAEEVGRLAVTGTDPPDDLHGSSTYRRSVGAHLAGRALTRALEEASNG